MKISIEDEVVYVGGSLDGKLVRPSLVNNLITFNQTNLPILHREDFFDGDYPFCIVEYYYYEEKDGKAVLKFGKSEKKEIMTI